MSYPAEFPPESPPAIGSERLRLARLARDTALEVCASCVVCGMVPLLALGEQVKAAVRKTAISVGLALDSVGVHVAAIAATENR